ncbi:hypothetical protein [Blastopirellula marina]|uniref:Uncharacterized protein n=1 Tax=Blastopirellula marina TaxID=124 RepID=A0A2S8GSF9_9BACT|nr:hypothetical protein [Blastopirellula marina]PQO47365.1 hypothetical protein C5Y93_04805 [Blastopirellula marina]
MPADSTANGNAMKLLWWIVGALWAVMMYFGTTTLNSLQDQVKENAKLTTKHESDIGYIKENIVSINAKLDLLIRDKYSAKSSSTTLPSSS